MITLGSPKMSVEAVNLQRNRIMKRQRHEAGVNNYVSTEVSDHEGGNGQDARKKNKVTTVDELLWRDNNSELKAAATTTTVDEKRKECREVAAAETTEVKWPWSNGMVDEQMSWALHCLPCWDVEYVGLAYNELYGDVAWDDDIWGIKGIHQVPTTTTTTTSSSSHRR